MVHAKVKAYELCDGFIVRSCGEAWGYTLVISADEALCKELLR